MKTVLLMIVALLMTAGVVRADHISVFSDATGSSCILAPGFTTTPTVIHKFTIGSVGSTFSLEFPAGSLFFGFAPAFPQPIPVVGYEGISLGYGQCMQGSFVVGTITAILTAPGILWVTPADGFSDVMVVDCEFVVNAATCGGAYVGISDPYCPSCQTVATDQKTWGAVKSLYR